MMHPNFGNSLLPIFFLISLQDEIEARLQKEKAKLLEIYGSTENPHYHTSVAKLSGSMNESLNNAQESFDAAMKKPKKKRERELERYERQKGWRGGGKGGRGGRRGRKKKRRDRSSEATATGLK
jgi:hypothetical protein